MSVNTTWEKVEADASAAAGGSSSAALSIMLRAALCKQETSEDHESDCWRRVSTSRTLRWEGSLKFGSRSFRICLLTGNKQTTLLKKTTVLLQPEHRRLKVKVCSPRVTETSQATSPNVFTFTIHTMKENKKHTHFWKSKVKVAYRQHKVAKITFRSVINIKLK